MPVAFAALMLVAACSRNDDAAGGLTADDQRQLNDAAAMLDANSVDLNAVDADAPANESTPR